MRRFHFYCLAIALLIATGCEHTSNGLVVPSRETYIPTSGAVAFDVEHLSGKTGAIGEWRATYTSHNKTARFHIVLEAPSSTEKFSGGNGRIVAEPNSDATDLLVDLQKALEAKSTPRKVQRIAYLPFEYVDLGDNQSQIPGGDGGFQGTPKGNWFLSKIFIGQGEDEGEVFLNLNPVLKKGEFSIKDSGYGDTVLANFAKVL